MYIYNHHNEGGKVTKKRDLMDLATLSSLSFRLLTMWIFSFSCHGHVPGIVEHQPVVDPKLYQVPVRLLLCLTMQLLSPQLVPLQQQWVP
jgi:hypothetical protein